MFFWLNIKLKHILIIGIIIFFILNTNNDINNFSDFMHFIRLQIQKLL